MLPHVYLASIAYMVWYVSPDCLVRFLMRHDVLAMCSGLVGGRRGQKFHVCDVMMTVMWLCRIDELLQRVDAGSQVVATEHVDVVEDVATPRRDSSITAWVPFLLEASPLLVLAIDMLCICHTRAATAKALLLTL